MLSSKLHSGTMSSSGRRWVGASSGKGKTSDGNFSQLDEQPEDTKPLGHGVEVRGGRVNGMEPTDLEALELQQGGIRVETEVRVSSDKLEYQDRLF